MAQQAPNTNREDHMKRLSEFFGPPNGPLTMSEYGHYDHFALPTAYLGKNLFLRDTIDGFIMDDFTWYTTKCLPYQRTDDINIQWNEINFDEHMVDRVPTEGVSRLIKSQRTRHNEKTVRRGIAFILEHGFLNTDEGKQQYILNIRQIKQAVQQTNNLDVVASCFYAPRYDKIWEKKHHVNQQWEEMMSEECANFAIVQKDAHGLDVLHQQFKQKMARYGISPNMWVFPPKMSMYLNMVSRENKEQWLAGDQGVARFNDPNNGTSFRDVTVYECDTFLDNSEEPINVLKRPVQVGEYYKMEPVDWDDEYRTKHRDIFIYDESKDNMQRISFKQALKATGRWTENNYTPDYRNVGEDIFTWKSETPTTDGSGYNKCKFWNDIDSKYITKEMLLEMNKKMMDLGEYQPSATGMKAPAPTQAQAQDTAPTQAPINLDALINASSEKIAASSLSSVKSHYENALKKYETQPEYEKVATELHDWLHSNDLNSEDVKGQYNVLKKITGDAAKDKAYWKRIGIDMSGPTKKQQRFAKKSKTSIDDILQGTSSIEADLFAGAKTDLLENKYQLKENSKIVKWLRSEINWENLQDLMDNNIPVPFTVLLFRPFMEYEMCSAMLMKGGAETGATYVGHNSFTLGDDVQSKLHYGNYTYYAKAVVREPKNIIVAENVFSDGYNSGNNCRFFGKIERNNLQDRNRSSASLIAMLVPAETREHMEPINPIDVRGKHKMYSDKEASHYVGSSFYNRYHDFEELEDSHSTNEMVDDVTHMNTTCYLGHYMFWGGKSYDKVNVNTGHWGKDVYPGCGKVRNGQMKYLENQHYNSSYM